MQKLIIYVNKFGIYLIFQIYSFEVLPIKFPRVNLMKTPYSSLRVYHNVLINRRRKRKVNSE